MSLYKILTITTLLINPLYCLASNWLQANLEYNQTIDSKTYKAQVTLLRPESYFIQNHATKIRDKLTVNLPEMGLDNVHMNIVDIKPFKGISIKANGIVKYKQIDEIDWASKTNRPVAATFARYTKEVYTYKFKNTKTGGVSAIHATPNHAFYVVNKHAYIPIAQVTATDELLSQTGETVKLQCVIDQRESCGANYSKPNKPTLVYNFEVYQHHRYFAGKKNNLLVHNGCLTNEQRQWFKTYAYTEVADRGDRVYVELTPGEAFPKAYGHDKSLSFEMEFGKDNWNFLLSNRSSTIKDVYGNHITQYMYELASKKRPYMVNKTPKYLIRSTISNKQTLEVIENHSNSKNFLDNFLTTPTGKHSKRVADDLGASISGIELLTGPTVKLELKYP